MNFKTKRRVTISVLGALVSLIGLSANMSSAADKYPSKPITIIVPFPPGGGTDLAVRNVQAKLQSQLGVPVIIENRPGAGGTIGTAAAAKASKDGHTLVAVTTTTIASAKAVYPKLNYDPKKDFVPIGTIGTTPFVLVVSPNLPVKSVDELVRHAKANNQKLSYGSIGNGSASHLVAELFKRRTGTEMTHVPYRGASPAQTDLMAGHIDVLFDNPAALVPFVSTGKMKALAVSAEAPVLPGIRSFESNGLPGFQPELWYGLSAPAGTPKQLVIQLQAALATAIKDPTIVVELNKKGITPVNMTPEEFSTRIDHDTKYWSDIAKTVDARVE